MERFAIQAAHALSQALESPLTASDLENPPDPTMGDFGFPCFRLSKTLRKSPPQIAQDIALKTAPHLPPHIQAKAVGPYVNFIVEPSMLLQSITKDILSDKPYGSLPKKTRGTWIIEYSSLNVAKPFQIYHLRPTAVGAALYRVGAYRGFNVVGINHLGDWGTQYGKLAVAVKLFAKDMPAEPTIGDLEKIYVRFHQELEKNPALEDQAREAFLKLEKNDPEITAFWKKCVEISLKEFDIMYKRLDIQFDHIWGESFYKDMLAPMLARFQKIGIVQESEGAQVVFLESPDKKEFPPCILQKKDGASIYATRDLAAAIYRQEKFDFDRMTYIVGGEQRLHFEQVFGVLKKAGYAWAAKCEHCPTGIYRFGENKMSTRKGNVVKLLDVIEEAKSTVTELMKERGMTAEEIQKNAEAIAVGAVVFFDLSHDPSRDVDFDVKRVVDFEGETGPYLQYAHTRCLSILRKTEEAGVKFIASQAAVDAASKLSHPLELQLVKKLGEFSLNLERVLKFNKPNQLANYLIDVTKAYGPFYRECHVLGQTPEVTLGRLALVESTRRILFQGLQLLGVPVPDRM